MVDNYKTIKECNEIVCYVVMTYYQLMYSIAHIKYNNKKAVIYISQDYVLFGDRLSDALLDSELVEDVVLFNSKNYLTNFFHQLRIEQPENAFENILENNLGLVFGDISDKHFYVFNEFQLYYYYVEKHCKSITVVEDGYNSYPFQKETLFFKGNFTLINKYIGNFFPKVHGESPKVVEFIVNSEIENLKYRKEMFTVQNLKVMMTDIGNDYLKRLFSKMFEFPEIKGDNIALLLTQPLARAKYCSLTQQIELYDKICSTILDSYEYIYIKPHPADKTDYSCLQTERIKIMSADFPIEVYNFGDYKFKFTYSFASTASGLAEYSHESGSMFQMEKFDFSKVAKFIRNEVKNHKLKLLKILHIDENFYEKSFLEKLSYEEKSTNRLTLFDVTTVIVNNSGRKLDVSYRVFASIKEALDSHDYNYCLLLRNSVIVKKKTAAGLLHVFKNYCPQVISLFSTLQCPLKGRRRYLELDDTSILVNNYNKVIARKFINDGKINIDEADNIIRINSIKSSYFSYYYTSSLDFDVFSEYIKNELQKPELKVDYYLNILKLAKLYGVKVEDYNIEVSDIVNYLSNKVVLSEVEGAWKKRKFETYIKNITYRTFTRKCIIKLRVMKRRFLNVILYKRRIK